MSIWLLGFLHQVASDGEGGYLLKQTPAPPPSPAPPPLCAPFRCKTPPLICTPLAPPVPPSRALPTLVCPAPASPHTSSHLACILNNGLPFARPPHDNTRRTQTAVPRLLNVLSQLHLRPLPTPPPHFLQTPAAPHLARLLNGLPQ